MIKEFIGFITLWEFIGGWFVVSLICVGLYSIVMSLYKRHEVKSTTCEQSDHTSLLSTLETAQMLTLSTNHLTYDTCNSWLSDESGPAWTKGEYGWFVYGGWSETRLPMPKDLRDCLDKVSALGCDWLMFDRDGPLLEGLPVYDW